MASPSEPVSLEAPASDQQLPRTTTRYWKNASPSSPAHILTTPFHALFALIGGCGIACFSRALVQQKPFDASLAAVLVILCVHIYALQSERCLRKAEWRESLSGVSGDARYRGSKSGSKAAADGTSELDLTGYAQTLGVSIRNGVIAKEGSTLNKILMDALGKEYLRCVAALKCYQTTFGPLQEDLDQTGQSLQQDAVPTHSEAFVPSIRVNVDNEPTMPSLNLSVSLAGLAGVSPAQTPRSPHGPPSPEPKRCHQPRPDPRGSNDISLTLQQLNEISATLQRSPRLESTASTSGPAHDEANPFHIGSSPCAVQQPAMSPEETALSPLRPCDPETHPEIEQPRQSFGLFGR